MPQTVTDFGAFETPKSPEGISVKVGASDDQLGRIRALASRIPRFFRPNSLGLVELGGLSFKISDERRNGRFLLGIFNGEPEEETVRMPLAFGLGNYAHVTTDSVRVRGMDLSEYSAEQILAATEPVLAGLEAEVASDVEVIPLEEPIPTQ